MPDTLCPTCHSRIGSDSLTEDGRTQGSDGVDDLGQPIPRWSDDPLFAAGGLNGTVYQGQRNKVRNDHILELQEARIQQEEAAGLPTPEFSPIPVGTIVIRRHIIELRQSVERLLDVSGLSLADYFSLDDTGAVQPQNPALGVTPQVEWTDVDRGASYADKDGNVVTNFDLPSGGTAQSPTLPRMTKIRAIHIEDLRHPIQAGVAALLISSIGQPYKSTKKGSATFKDTEICS